MNILITGINGFVGSNLVKALKGRHTIYGLDIKTPDKEGVLKTFTWDELDALPPYDVVIHLAGIAHDTRNWTNAQVYFDVNTGLTSKMYDTFLKSDARKFIFFSSVKAAADSIEGILTEDVIPAPKGPYGESKIAAENYILSRMANENTYNTKKNNSEVQKSTYILRPCMIHGPGNKGNMNLLFSFVRRGVPWPLGAYDNHRSFASVDNLTFIINGLIEKNIPSGIYNIGDDEPVSTNRIISLMGDMLKKRIRILQISPRFISFMAGAGTFLHLPLNRERLQKLTENYIVSNNKIKEGLGIEKLPVSAEDGLKKTIRSFGKS